MITLVAKAMRAFIEMLALIAILAVVACAAIWLAEHIPHAHSHGDLEYALSQVK